MKIFCVVINGKVIRDPYLFDEDDCTSLGLKTDFIVSTELCTNGTKDDKMIDICLKLGGTCYISGSAGINYIIPEKFSNNAIELAYIDYIYPLYKQVYDPFTHYVTILNLIFNCGSKTSDYIWGWEEVK